MNDRRFHRLGGRRLLAGIVAAILGAVGSLAVATPSRADTTCSVSYTVSPDFTTTTGLVKADIQGTITNTGPATSANWLVLFAWPQGVTNVLYWNLARSSFSGNLYFAASWNKTIPAGSSTGFGFVITKSGTGVSSQPTVASCSIVY